MVRQLERVLAIIKREEGAESVEYALGLAFFVLALTTALALLGANLATFFGAVGSYIAGFGLIG